jgi:hypothetical protein
MPKIQSFIYATGFFQPPVYNNTNNALLPLQPMGVLVDIDVAFIPTHYSFVIFIGLTNVTDSDTISYQFLPPEDNKPIINIDAKDIPLHPQDSRTQVGFDFRNITIKIAGEYKSVVTVNGEKFEFPITVRHRPELNAIQ